MLAIVVAVHRADVDEDGDGVCSPAAVFDAQWCSVRGGSIVPLEDNCPADFNPLQEDSDSDGDGDACDGACHPVRHTPLQSAVSGELSNSCATVAWFS